MSAKVTRRQTLLALGSCGSAAAFGFEAFGQSSDAKPKSELKPRKPKQPELKQPEQLKQSTKPSKWLALPETPPLPEPSAKGLLPINGTQIFYAQFGDGPSVLLLHGGMANSSYWGAQINELAKSFRVTVIDTRGHGRSPLVSNAMSYELFAKDVIEALKVFKIPRTAVIGWSDGAITGIQLATTNSHLITGLFAFGANTSLAGLIAGGAATPVFRSFSSRAAREYAALSPHPEKWSELSRALSKMWHTQPNFSRKQLSAITCRVTVSDGEHDEIIKPEHTRQMADSIPGAGLVILKDVSHFAMLQDPNQFNAALNTFLSDLS